MAQYYRRNLAGETAKGKRARVAAGLVNGDPPYGYHRAMPADLPAVVGDADALQTALRLHPYVVVPERAEAVTLAFEWYATGEYSDAEIAAALNGAGYRMVSKRQPDGGPFQKDTMTAILQDPYYVGKVSYAGHKTHGMLDLACGDATARRRKRRDVMSPSSHPTCSSGSRPCARRITSRTTRAPAKPMCTSRSRWPAVPCAANYCAATPRAIAASTGTPAPNA